jgi:TolA-binding protein
MDRFAQAEQIEGRRPADALEIYRDLAQGSDAWAENALFAEGRLQADVRNDSEARALFKEYLGRYPHGPNADDARHFLERLR